MYTREINEEFTLTNKTGRKFLASDTSKQKKSYIHNRQQKFLLPVIFDIPAYFSGYPQLTIAIIRINGIMIPYYL